MKTQLRCVWIPNFQGGINVVTVLSCIWSASMTCSTNRYNAFLGEEVQFHCNITNVAQARWRRNMTSLFVGKIHLTHSDNIKVSVGNYSLYADSISWADEGIYECIQDNNVVSTYCLYVISK